MHRPVLARNPAPADHLLQGVVGGPLPAPDLPDQEAARGPHLALANHRPSERFGPVRAAIDRLSPAHGAARRLRRSADAGG